LGKGGEGEQFLTIFFNWCGRFSGKKCGRDDLNRQGKGGSFFYFYIQYGSLSVAEKRRGRKKGVLMSVERQEKKKKEGIPKTPPLYGLGRAESFFPKRGKKGGKGRGGRGKKKN